MRRAAMGCCRRAGVGALALLLVSALVSTRVLAAEASGTAYEIHVITSLSGAGGFLGQQQQTMLKGVEKTVNEAGGIGGRPVHFIVQDDQTSAQLAVQLATSAIADHPAVILGSTVTAACEAMAPLMRNGPVMYCFSPGIRPAPGGYVFSGSISHDDAVKSVMGYFKARGWTRIALVMGTDATGRDGERAVDRAMAMPEFADFKIVERVHFNTTDLSLAAQIARVKAADPQAVITWTTGAPALSVLRDMSQAALKLPVVMSAGNLSYTLIDQFKTVLPGDLEIATGAGLIHDPRLKLDPRVAAASDAFFAAFRDLGQRPETGAGTAWDAVMITMDALRHLGPGATATQLRDYIANLQGYGGIWGLYDFKKNPQRGVDGSSSVIVHWVPEEADFEALIQPGGGLIAP